MINILYIVLILLDNSNELNYDDKGNKIKFGKINSCPN
jgi:hypothetical protein